MREEWVETTLGEIVTLEYGKALPEAKRDGGVFPVFGSAGIVGGHSEALTDTGPAIVVGRKGTAGALHWSRTPCWPIDTTYFVKPKLAFAGELPFLLLVLEHADLPALSAQTGVPGLNRDRVYSQSVLVPPPEEQRRIVELMASVDAAAVVTTAAAQGARDSAGALRRRVFASSEWPVGRLSEAVEVVMGRQRSPAHATGGHMVRYLRAANVKDGELKLGGVLQMNFTPSEQQKYRLRAGDVLVSEGCGSLDEIGASARWDDNLSGVVCFQNTLLRLRAMDGISAPGFVYQWARWAYESGEFARTSQGTNIFHIGARRAVTMPFPKVPLDTQVRVGSEIESLDAVGEAIDDELAALTSTRRALLDSLLSGAHTIPDSYDRFLEGVA